MIMYNTGKYLSRKFLFTLCICFWTSFARLETDATASPEVTILQGRLRGVTLLSRHQRNFSGFLGIPYAQPPVKDLRFANPVAANGWKGTRNATADLMMCPQAFGNTVIGDEDCLYLNVFTPQLPGSTKTSLLPVMVYIHGSAFVGGDGRADRYSPKYLLDSDIVLVGPNYRIGALGFLSTGDEVASGNWGLKDQVLVLQWVQKNIEYFGGDPGRVTLFGSSAGSASVGLLALSKSTTGLFHRYITQSGSALAPWAYQPRATYSRRAFELGKYVGCSSDASDSLINCLRTVDSADIIAAYSKFLVWRNYPPIVWTTTDEPDIEGAVLTDSPTNLFANKGAHDLPWISGIVRDEGLMHSVGYFEDEKMFDEFLENIDEILPEMLSITHQPDSGAAWVSALKSYYFNDDLTTNRSVSFASNLTLLITDALFRYPAYDALRRQLDLAESPEYYYTFDYRGTFSYTGDRVNYGITHGDELMYLFTLQTISEIYNKTASETDYEMVDTMVRLWTSFAIDGTPTYLNSGEIAEWHPYSEGESYIQIGNETDVKVVRRSSLFTRRMQFWSDLTTPSAAVNFSSKSLLIFILPLISSIFVLSGAS